MSRLIREPLVHFIIIGFMLFAGHGLWTKHVSKADYTIHVSAAEIQRQAVIFASENQRQPSDEDIQGLLFAHVEEQILMREAARLGLDDNDTIIRRRMAQKMRFMLSEDTPPPLPKESVLRDWFAQNKSQFQQPASRAFTHVYFSPSEHDNVTAVAQSAMASINDDNWNQMGDPFIEPNTVSAMDQISVTRRFGPNFASDLFALPVDQSWQGPLESAFGVHVVRIDFASKQSAPDFETALPDIEKQWRDQALREANTKRLEDLLGEYKVEVEDLEP